VPALNEEQVVEKVVREIWSVVDASIQTYEIILVDDGSTDRTGSIMDRVTADLPHTRTLHNSPNIGLGASYARGLSEAKLDYVMMLCGDGGLPAASLQPIFAKIGSADIVIPYMVNLREIKTPLRYAISRAYTLLINLLFGYNLRYYNGLPVHRRSSLEQISITSSGFAFQAEILIKLLRLGHTFVDVGVEGVEPTNRSTAFHLKNLLSVGTTLYKLVREIRRFSSAPAGAHVNEL
jgi:glycosyltransferase involved in cell wall biosynthesis